MPVEGEQVRSSECDLDEQQRKLDRVLRVGLFFGLVWLGGIGSIIAFVSGVRARRIIDSGDGELEGNFRSLACILAGLAGIGMWAVILFVVLAGNP